MSYRQDLLNLLDKAKYRCDAAEITKREAELACPPFPASLQYLWQIFTRLSARRGSNGFGPALIQWSDIQAFIALTKTRLLPWEIEIIEHLDVIWLNEIQKRAPTSSEKP